jgi:hypothetical protein
MDRPLLGFFALAAALGCAERPPRPVARSDADARAIQLLREADARGAVVVLEVQSGEDVAATGVGRDVAAPVLPLSVIKLYLAAMWWDRQLADEGLERPGVGPVTVHEVLVHGYDRPAAQMAVELRRKFGGDAVLSELRRYGLGTAPGSLTLAPDADDATWGSVLSIGEREVTATPRQVSRFLRMIGDGGSDLLRPETARRLQAAMRDAVTRGTARAAAPRLAGTDWQLGGKTGSGPDEVGPGSDGWFAGLIFERGRPRYTVAVYVDRRGPGGGVATSIAADLARAFATGAAARP